MFKVIKLELKACWKHFVAPRATKPLPARCDDCCHPTKPFLSTADPLPHVQTLGWNHPVSPLDLSSKLHCFPVFPSCTFSRKSADPCLQGGARPEQGLEPQQQPPPSADPCLQGGARPERAWNKSIWIHGAVVLNKCRQTYLWSGYKWKISTVKSAAGR